MNCIKADKNDVDSIFKVLSLCADDMSTRGLNHWIPYYPKQRIIDDISNKSVYIVEDNNRIIGTFTIIIDSKALYLSKFAIIPDCSGRGVGTKCLTFIENICKKNGISVIKLDVYERSLDAIRFYEKNGFIIFGKKPTRRFVVFEMEKELI